MLKESEQKNWISLKKFADQKDVKNLTAIQVSNFKVALNYS